VAIPRRQQRHALHRNTCDDNRSTTTIGSLLKLQRDILREAQLLTDRDRRRDLRNASRRNVVKRSGATEEAANIITREELYR